MPYAICMPYAISIGGMHCHCKHAMCRHAAVCQCKMPACNMQYVNANMPQCVNTNMLQCVNANMQSCQHALRPVHNIRMGERCDRKCIQIDLDARCNVHVRWNRNQFYSSVCDAGKLRDARPSVYCEPAFMQHD